MVVDRLTDAIFARRVLIAIGVVALALLLWHLVDLLLLVFGAVLVAVILRALAQPIAHRTQLSDPWSLAAATLGLVVLISLASWLFGAEVYARGVELAQRLPEAWQAFEERVGAIDLGQRLMSRVEDAAPSAGSVVSGVAGVATTFVGAMTDLLLIVVGGLYLAAQPGLYRQGFLMLFPPHGARERVAGAVDASGRALRLWLLGQLAAMVSVGILTGLGLWVIGVPSAFALALLAGLADFVPLVGPIVAAVPALLIALSQGWETMLWTLLLYILVQQIESNLIVPIAQRRTVSLPPAITLFAVVAFGLLFGLLGVLFATPLAVVVLVAVKKLWVREVLGEPTEMPGER